jgi:hypothetical protein
MSDLEINQDEPNFDALQSSHPGNDKKNEVKEREKNLYGEREENYFPESSTGTNTIQESIRKVNDESNSTSIKIDGLDDENKKEIKTENGDDLITIKLTIEVKKDKEKKPIEKKKKLTKDNKNGLTETEEEKDEKMLDWTLIKNYLVEGELPHKEFKYSNNFVSNSEISFVKRISMNPPTILIMKTIENKILYTVYQNLYKRDFSVIKYNLQNVKNWKIAESLIIVNYPYLDNDYLFERYIEFVYYFSNGGKKEIIFPTTEQSKNSKRKKKSFNYYLKNIKLYYYYKYS